MSMMLIALLVVLLPPLETGAAQTTSAMHRDVDRLVQAGETLAGTWPSQPSPPIPEVAIVARHGKAVVPLLMVLLSDDPHAERDRQRWNVQQQVALTLSRIYSESPHCGRIYCDGDPPERIGIVRGGWLNVIATDKELQALSARDLIDRFKMEMMDWSSSTSPTLLLLPMIAVPFLSSRGRYRTRFRWHLHCVEGLTLRRGRRWARARMASSRLRSPW